MLSQKLYIGLNQNIMTDNLSTFHGLKPREIYTNITHIVSREKTFDNTETRIYIYSAHIKRITINNHVAWKIMTAAWIHEPIMHSEIKCCVKYHNSTLTAIRAATIQPWFVEYGSELTVMIHYCKFYLDPKIIKSISLELAGKQCSGIDDRYVVPNILTVPKRHHIGLCGKLIYGNIDGDRLIEWFEFLKLVGVDHVIAYPYNITSQYAKKVLQHYQADGLLQLVPGFDFPEKG